MRQVLSPLQKESKEKDAEGWGKGRTKKSCMLADAIANLSAPGSNPKHNKRALFN